MGALSKPPKLRSGALSTLSELPSEWSNGALIAPSEPPGELQSKSPSELQGKPRGGASRVHRGGAERATEAAKRRVKHAE